MAKSKTIEESPTNEEATTALATSNASGLVTPDDLPATDFDGRIEAAGNVLRDIIQRDPELGEALQEIVDYTAARVEGVAGEQAIPIPYVSICQKMTKEDSLPGEVKVGELYTRQEPLGPTLKFIPLFFSYKRAKFVTGSDSPECYSIDGKIGSKWGNCAQCPHARYEEGARSACSGGHSVAMVSEDFRHLYVTDFTKTSSSAGKKLKTMALDPRGVFTRGFELFTKKESNAKGEYYVFKTKPTGVRPTGTQYEAARALFQYFQARHDRQLVQFMKRVNGDDTAGGYEGAIPASGGAALPESAGDQEPSFGEGV